jgi:hypothetical protein
MPGGRFWLVIYPGPVHVDWNIGPWGSAAIPEAAHLLFAKRPIPVATEAEAPDPADLRRRAQANLEFFWAMAPIAFKYGGRGHTRLAVQQIGLLEHALQRLWLTVHHPAWLNDAYHQNRRIEPALDALLPRLPVVIRPLDTVEAVRAYCTAMEALHPRLADVGAAVSAQLPDELRELYRLARAQAERGGSNPNEGSRR